MLDKNNHAPWVAVLAGATFLLPSPAWAFICRATFLESLVVDVLSWWAFLGPIGVFFVLLVTLRRKKVNASYTKRETVLLFAFFVVSSGWIAIELANLFTQLGEELVLTTLGAVLIFGLLCLPCALLSAVSAQPATCRLLLMTSLATLVGVHVAALLGHGVWEPFCFWDL